MKPSEKAVWEGMRKHVDTNDFYSGLEVAYSIDIAPLEQRIKELEAENERLKTLVDNQQGENKVTLR